jgi:hypothetical protein
MLGRAGKERGTHIVVTRGERVLLRPGRPEDVEGLAGIRSEPKIARLWGSEDIEEEGFRGTDERDQVEEKLPRLVENLMDHGETLSRKSGELRLRS